MGERLYYLRPNLKRGKRGGQIITFLILAMVIILLFVSITLNIVNVSQKKATLSQAADKASLKLASNLGSYSHMLSKRYLGGKTQKCKSSWGAILSVIILIIVIIIIIIVAICTMGSGLAAFLACMNPGLLGGSIIAAAAIHLFVVIPNQISALNRALADMEPDQQFRVQTLTTVFYSTIDDPIEITDEHDIDEDGRTNDKIYRFNELMYMAINDIANANDRYLRGRVGDSGQRSGGLQQFVASETFTNFENELKRLRNEIREFLVYLVYRREDAQSETYYCPQHRSYTSNSAGRCPICNTALVHTNSYVEVDTPDDGHPINPYWHERRHHDDHWDPYDPDFYGLLSSIYNSRHMGRGDLILSGESRPFYVPEYVEFSDQQVPLDTAIDATNNTQGYDTTETGIPDNDHNDQVDNLQSGLVAFYDFVHEWEMAQVNTTINLSNLVSEGVLTNTERAFVQSYYGYRLVNGRWVDRAGNPVNSNIITVNAQDYRLRIFDTWFGELYEEYSDIECIPTGASCPYEPEEDYEPVYYPEYNDFYNQMWGGNNTGDMPAASWAMNKASLDDPTQIAPLPLLPDNWFRPSATSTPACRNCEADLPAATVNLIEKGWYKALSDWEARFRYLLDVKYRGLGGNDDEDEDDWFYRYRQALNTAVTKIRSLKSAISRFHLKLVDFKEAVRNLRAASGSYNTNNSYDLDREERGWAIKTAKLKKDGRTWYYWWKDSLGWHILKTNVSKFKLAKIKAYRKGLTKVCLKLKNYKGTVKVRVDRFDQPKAFSLGGLADFWKFQYSSSSITNAHLLERLDTDDADTLENYLDDFISRGGLKSTSQASYNHKDLPHIAGGS